MHVALSPDGRRIAVDRAADDGQSIWVREISTGAFSRISFEGNLNMRPSWSHDGSRIAWVSPRDSTAVIRVKRADGAGPTTTLLSASNVWDVEWSRDGEWLVYRQFNARDTDDLFAVRTRGDTTPIPIMKTPFFERAGTLSPDARYVAYVSGESGRDEIYVRPFPNADDGRWLVSVGGGSEPRWSRDGRELFYVSNETVDLTSVGVTLGDRFAFQPPRRLFSVAGYVREGNSRTYDVTPDGRFVMLRGGPTAPGAPVLVENWAADLRRKLGK
jgi:Tol biopolymer transport system component